jgi:hypothetical protein
VVLIFAKNESTKEAKRIIMLIALQPSTILARKTSLINNFMDSSCWCGRILDVYPRLSIIVSLCTATRWVKKSG